MPLMIMKDVCKSYGSQCLLDHVSFNIPRNTRVALIGRNGEGKSTLLKIIAGSTAVDSGHVTYRNGARISYLPQDPHIEPGQTVFEYVVQGLEEQAVLLADYQALLHSDALDESGIRKLGELQEKLEISGAWQNKNDVETVISRLDLDADALTDNLSGGWKRRVSLARTLVSKPDLLLLDEPTNHLDVDSIDWLEDFIADFKGAVIFITHDRYFLDAQAEEIIELDRGTLRQFSCGYSEYLQKKAELLEQEGRQSKKFDRMLADEEKWIRRGIPARRSRDEGRVRRLQDLRRQRAERRMQKGNVELCITQGLKSGKMMIDVKELNHSFDEKVIIKDLDFRLMSGERLGFIGPNGVGKTTLLRLLLGELETQQGIIKHGAKLAPAFLTQMRQLDEKALLSDVLLPQGGNHVYVAGLHPRHIVSYLEEFLFDKEKLKAPVSSLSGGERGRLLLAKLLLEPANLLILDEPTNDLDIGTLSVLEEALSKYQGTILIVSHDRAFMDRVANRVLAFEGEGKIVAIEGGYSDYAAWKINQASQVEATAKKQVKADKNTSAKKQKKLSYKENQALQKLPLSIETLEAEMEAIHQRFCDDSYFKNEPEKYQKDTERLQHIETEVAELYVQWEALEEKQSLMA
ncbi:MAG: ATP-binding cassette domain-containing protein [Mariprofundaceae bacterium]|nr:ATP-binding cassette domain-containing protein [Mariprofundaceae bacterium]